MIKTIDKNSTKLWDPLNDLNTLPSTIDIFDDPFVEEENLSKTVTPDGWEIGNQIVRLYGARFHSRLLADENPSLDILSSLYLGLKVDRNRSLHKEILNNLSHSTFRIFSKTKNIENPLASLYFGSGIFISYGAKVINNNLALLFNKIDSLLKDEEGDYDDEFLIPTQHAVDKMKSVISELYKKFGDSLNFVKFVPNGKGGIEAVLRKNGRLLQLIVPPNENKEPYLFHKEGAEYKIEQFTNIVELSDWIDWLLEA